MQLFSFLFFFSAIVFFSVNFNSLGENPSGEDLLRIRQSKQFSSTRDHFVNRLENLVPEMQKNFKFWDMSKRFFFNQAISAPSSLLPQDQPDLQDFTKPSHQLKFIWLGHSTFLINIAGKILLIDPVFSMAASPVIFLGRRFQDPPLTLAQLPPVDYIVISHDHYDHLDYESIIHFSNSQTKFLMPLGVGSHLRSWGISPSRVIELDWWSDISFPGIKFICTPAQHFSGRTATDGNKTLWASWVVQTKDQNFFYSGDTGYDIHFKSIGDKYGPFDIAFMENGQYNELWHAVHLLPQEGAQAYFDLRAAFFVPVHWGMFNLALHNWYDPIEAISSEADRRGIRLLTPKLGQLIELPKPVTKTLTWWKKFIPNSNESFRNR